MPTTLRAFASNTNTSAGSAFSTSITLPTSGPGGTVAIGDLVLIAAISERTEIPTVSYAGTSTGVNIIRSTGNTNYGSVIAWRRILTSSDLGASVSMSNTAGRRQTLGVIVIAGAQDPVITSGVNAGIGPSVTTDTAPAVTPTAADAFLVAIMSYLPYSGTLYGRTSTVASPYTERVDAMGAYTGGSNPGIAIATQQLTGGSGVSQAGATWTVSESNFNAIADTITLLPATVTSAPDLTLTDKGALYVFEASGVAKGGGTLSFSISQVSGVTTTPIALGTQRWGVTQDTQPLVYQVVETETSNPSPQTQQFTVPGISTKGLSRRRKLTISGWA